MAKALHLPMNDESVDVTGTRKTTAEELFRVLKADIEDLRLPPGTKLSEAVVAKKYNVSRQPVREAFIRLDHISLVIIQPQKATRVKRISKSNIVQSRFVRMAVEVETARIACKSYRGEKNDAIQENLDKQLKAVEDANYNKLRKLDYKFHELICAAAACDFAYDVIKSSKATVDRLRVLQLSSKTALKQVHTDHLAIFKSLKKNDEAGMVEHTRQHLSRIDDTINTAQIDYSDYFED